MKRGELENPTGVRGKEASARQRPLIPCVAGSGAGGEGTPHRSSSAAECRGQTQAGDRKYAARRPKDRGGSVLGKETS